MLGLIMNAAAKIIYFRKEMVVAEEGISIFTKTFHSVYETEYFHFCVSERDIPFFQSFRKDGKESLFQFGKRIKRKIYRIAKRGSRIADATEDAAMASLRYRKTRQIKHLKRDLAIVERFVADTEGRQLRDFEVAGDFRTLAGTQELVNQFYRFD